MLKVKKLKDNATVLDLVLNECYIGEGKEEFIMLNNNVKIKTGEKRKGFIPVRIKKIVPPNKVEIEVVKEQFTVVSEPKQKIRFFLKSDIIRKLEPQIKRAVNIISNAAKNGRLIILRHHADCDGYAGALALEEVLIPIIEKKNEKVWQSYKRMPMKAPFYEYTDALKDLSYFKNEISFGKKPLLIIVDNGCGEEDLLALKKVKLYDVDIVVIDHHVFAEEVNKVVDVHLNPRVAGGEGDITSGMLSYEIAAQIGNPNPIYPALSGVADKSRNEFLEPYMRLAHKDRKFLEKLAKCVDFEAYNLRFMESNLIYDFFNEKQKRTMDLILSEVEKRTDKRKIIIKKFLKHEKLKKGTLYCLELDKTVPIREYPSPGKTVGIAHKMNKGPRITLGFSKDMITFRIDGVPFSVVNALKALKKKIPYGNINGGGHNYAGTIKFIPAVEKEVRKELIKHIKSV